MKKTGTVVVIHLHTDSIETNTAVITPSLHNDMIMRTSQG